MSLNNEHNEMTMSLEEVIYNSKYRERLQFLVTNENKFAFKNQFIN